MNTRNELLGNLASFITFVVTSALLLLSASHLQYLGYARQQIGFVATFMLLTLLVSAVLGSILAKITQRRRTLLLVAICGSALMLMVIPLVRSTAYLHPALGGLTCFLGPVIPLLHQLRPRFSGNQMYLYGHVWPWAIAAWGLAVFLLARLGGQYGLHNIFFGSALLMYVVLLIADRLTKVNY